MKKIIYFLFIIFFWGCNLFQPPVNVYFCGGQSNATVIWYETIKAEILKVDPTAIVIHNYHPGNSLMEWYTSYPKDNYIEDMGIIKSYLDDVNYNFKGFIWWQGESDRFEGYYQQYENRFMAMIKEFKKDVKDYNFSVVMTIVASMESAPGIRMAQIDTINNNNFIYGFDSAGYERLPGSSHMTDVNYIKIAIDTAKFIMEIIY